MKSTIINRILTAFTLLILLNAAGRLAAQNGALHFDGENDFITLSPINGFQPDDDFTVEMWLMLDQHLDCNHDYKVIFSLYSQKSHFQAGICNDYLYLEYFSDHSGISSGVINIPIGFSLNQWYHLAIVREHDKVLVYLNCDPVWDNSNDEKTILMVFESLFLGQSFTGFENRDFRGMIDDFRLWNKSRYHHEINYNCNHCVPSVNQNGLLVYWPFDDGDPGNDNTHLTMVSDNSSNGNHGALSLIADSPPGFQLHDQESNFILSSMQFHQSSYHNMQMLIQNYSQGSILNEICNGTPLHFSVLDENGQILSISSSSTFYWEYSDDGGLNFTQINPGPNSEFNGIAFPVVSNNPNILIVCHDHPFGYVDRIFRFVVLEDNGSGSTCEYLAEYSLKICCPVTGPYIQVNNPGFTTNQCEGTVIQFDLTIMNTGLPAPSTDNYVTIDWFVNINGTLTPLTGPGYDNQTNILYPASGTMTLTTGSIYFYAVVGNCACPSGQADELINVEAQPICGTIKPADQNPLIPAFTPDHYYICPGLSTTLEVDQPFANCNMIWEYMFPSEGTWHPTNGTGNHAHNTNILPQISPSNSPYLWPSGETCIKYRIKCLPLNHPNSACAPCYSNEITICLIDTPQKPVIDADPNPFCFGSYSELSVLNPESGINYTWIHNGIHFGHGNPVQTVSPGNYWVFASDPYGCHSVKSDKLFVNSCVVKPVISCPQPDCPCTGDEILLSAALSASNCSSSLSFHWSWDSGQLVSVNGSELTHIPAPTGTTYTVIVTDAYGCSASKQTFVMPCDCSTSFTCGTSTVTFDYGYSGLLVTYGTVVGADNRCWLDRNLGASQVATSSTDSDAYGDLFQWGRLADGHQIRTSPATATLSNSDVPGHGNFILAPNSPWDWRSTQNNNLWQGEGGTNNPCPDGYRLPTEDEWLAEHLSWAPNNNAAGAFASSLKLPMAGLRNYDNGTVSPVGTTGHYWSSTVVGTHSQQLNFSSSLALMSNFLRARGSSVRCIKD